MPLLGGSNTSFQCSSPITSLPPLFRVLTDSNNIRTIIRIFVYSKHSNIRRSRIFALFEYSMFSNYSIIRIFGVEGIFVYSNIRKKFRIQHSTDESSFRRRKSN
ncbi:hypothetical protein Y032_0100g3262 [Ancylostoma ceylanicum]|uniref:Uncharacterized protein n=1 Tax=Ancylostoma ceylanicum TaxID=53326 RepID=A0A016THB0_9BILA|nr:hypothetical protein Y032_0100g3262 [Ancylostoma ceylanicum]